MTALVLLLLTLSAGDVAAPVFEKNKSNKTEALRLVRETQRAQAAVPADFDAEEAVHEGHLAIIVRLQQVALATQDVALFDQVARCTVKEARRHELVLELGAKNKKKTR